MANLKEMLSLHLGKCGQLFVGGASEYLQSTSQREKLDRPLSSPVSPPCPTHTKEEFSEKGKKHTVPPPGGGQTNPSHSLGQKQAVIMIEISYCMKSDSFNY